MSKETDSQALDQLIQRLRLAAWGRLGIMALFAIATYSAFRESLRAPTPRLLLLTVAILIGISLLTLIAQRQRSLARALGYLQLLGDLLLASVTVYLTGGAESAFSILYHLIVIVAAFLFGARGARMTALGAIAAFAALSLSLHGDVIESPTDLLVTPSLEPRELGYYLAINATGLALVAALAGYLSERERKVGGKLLEARKATADLAALNEDIVRSLTVGLTALDRRGQLLWLNPAGYDILGFSTESPATAEAVRSLLGADGTLPGEGQQRESTFERPDGRELTLSLRAAPLLDSEGTTHGTLLIFQDITELRKMEVVVSHAERLAALGRLAAGLAHELRNPLGSLSGSLQLIREAEQIGDDEQRLIRIMLSELDRLADLVTQMLDLARPPSPHPLPIDLVSLIREVVEVIAASAEADELEFTLELPDQLTVELDPDQARQLVWNLLRNAVQASPPESAVKVTLGRGQRGEVSLEIEDSGPGIAPEDRKKVFDPFYSTKRGGIGMGLAICRQVVEAHGGSLLVEGAEPQGSLFRVTLPGKKSPLRPSGEESVEEKERLASS